MNMTIIAPALSLGDRKAWLWATVFVAGNVLLPQLCHLIPSGGKMFLPIMLFTIIATVRFGMWCGLITALASPLLSLALFGVPSGIMLTAVLIKSIIIAMAFGLWREWRGGYTFWSLLFLVVGCQLVCFPLEGLLLFGMGTSWNDLLISLPGMALQLAAAYMVVRYSK